MESGSKVLIIRVQEYMAVNLLRVHIMYTYIFKFERHQPSLETTSPCIYLLFSFSIFHTDHALFVVWSTQSGLYLLAIQSAFGKCNLATTEYTQSGNGHLLKRTFHHDGNISPAW